MGSDIIKNRAWEDVKRILSRYYGEWTKPDYPGAVNDRIPNTAILGNGDIGISLDGSSTEKIFNISKGNFWEYNGSPLKLTSLSTRTDANVTVSLKAHIYGGNTEPPDETIRSNSFQR